MNDLKVTIDADLVVKAFAAMVELVYVNMEMTKKHDQILRVLNEVEQVVDSEEESEDGEMP